MAAHEAASVILEAKVAISKQLLKTKLFNEMERWKLNRSKKLMEKQITFKDIKTYVKIS